MQSDKNKDKLNGSPTKNTAHRNGSSSFFEQKKEDIYKDKRTSVRMSDHFELEPHKSPYNTRRSKQLNNN